ncbi:MAG: iron ABC transporter permease [Deltaproteobacteria bacterium]|nr:iron ABC transporter permease [Deltaproteobacteria bacterium]
MSKRRAAFIFIALPGAAAFIALICFPVFINPFNPDPVSQEILFSVRLPRVLTAILIGACLGASGAVLQGVLRNPLADPYILGISSGASFFAAFGLIISSSLLAALSVNTLAFIGAALVCVIVGWLGSKGARIVPERLLLAGIGTGFIFTSALMLLLSVSSDPGLRRALTWIFGDLSGSDWNMLPYAFVLMAAGLAITFTRLKALDALILGNELCHSLGFSPSKERLLFFVAVSLMTAASVALGGVIGFIGLLVPHIVRFSGHTTSNAVVPYSMALGAALLTVSDTAAKTIIAPTELPSGIITVLIGAPYFLYLLRKKTMLGD